VSGTYPRRLIEVDLPIKRISAHARREKSIRHGHISTLHIWWARRPLAACRAVICAALWPDPADDLCPEAFRQAVRRLMHDWAANHLDLVSAESYPRFLRLRDSAGALPRLPRRGDPHSLPLGPHHPVRRPRLRRGSPAGPSPLAVQEG
jgi:hypothetical protein